MGVNVIEGLSGQENYDSRRRERSVIHIHTASFSGPFEAISSSFGPLENKSVPKHGAKNMLPVIERCTVPAATMSHIMIHIPVNI